MLRDSLLAQLALVALCGAAPAGRYVISNGTVADSKTGLTWEQAVDPKGASLAGAQAICDTLLLGGQGGWRLPTVKELYSILDFEGGAAAGSVPLIDPTAFPGSWPTGSSAQYFAVTPVYSRPGYVVAGHALAVSFANGQVVTLAGGAALYRCVRGP